jgi:hypothetical protein
MAGNRYPLEVLIAAPMAFKPIQGLLQAVRNSSKHAVITQQRMSRLSLF